MNQKEDEEVRSVASTKADVTRVQQPGSKDQGMQSSYERGLAFKEAGQYQQALACLDQAREDPAMAVKADVQTALCYKAADRLDDAAMVLRELLKDKKGTDGERRQIRYLLARIYERLGRTEQAVAHYRILQQADPAFRDTAARLGQLSSSRGWSSVLARPFTGSWLRSMTKSWVHLLRISM
jgi:tetratricopeptide (TPR) repeat protein